MSPLDRSCPTCKAQAGRPCRSYRRDYFHRARQVRPERETLPDLRDWWKAMAKFEGQFAAKRPASLEV